MGAAIGFGIGVTWRVKHDQPLGAADAPVDGLLRQLRRLSFRDRCLVVIGVVITAASLIANIMISVEWNTAKDATEKADRALSCQQFNDRESTRAQILAAEANIQQRSDQIGFLTAQRAFLAPLAPGLPRDAAEVGKRFHDYLVSLNDAIVSLERANQSGAKLIKELKERDIECIRDARGAPR